MSDNCYEIFKYLNPKENDKISILGKDDIEEFIYYLNKYYLEFRHTLGLSNDVTFGLEVESENLTYTVSRLNKMFEYNLLKDWKVEFDTSLTKGCEAKSPILTDCFNDWSNLIKVCYILSEYTSIGINSSAHVHVGAQVLGEERNNWLNFIILWAAYEKIIFRFAYGEFLTSRPRIMAFAKMVVYQFLDGYNSLKNSNYDYLRIANTLSSITRNQAVNFKNVGMDKNTIEFRCPNGTLNPIIWQNNVNLFVHLLEYASSSKFDLDIVLNRCADLNASLMSLSKYKGVYLDQAIELSDLIFDNNLDKIYFLRQYLKSYEIGNSPLEEARHFVRELGIKK